MCASETPDVRGGESTGMRQPAKRGRALPEQARAGPTDMELSRLEAFARMPAVLQALLGQPAMLQTLPLAADKHRPPPSRPPNARSSYGQYRDGP